MHRPAAHLRPRPRALSVALLVLGLCAIGLTPVLASYHRATHVHVTCAHGEQIDLGSHADGHVAATPRPTDGDPRVLDAGGGATGTEEGHHHCTLGCVAAVTLGAAPIVAHAVALAPAAPVRTPILVLRTAQVLADAPKTSPPV